MGKLHAQMRDDLLPKAYSPHILKANLSCVRHFVRHFMRSPQEMGEQEVRDFLLHLVRDRQASPPRPGHMSTPSSSSAPLP